MTFKELKVYAAQLAKDLEQGATDFVGYDTRFNEDTYGWQVNRAYDKLLHKLPSCLIRSHPVWTKDVVGGMFPLPSDYLRPVRLCITPTGQTGCVGARYISNKERKAAEQNSYLSGTADPTYDPQYFYSSLAGTTQYIRFVIDFDGTASLTYIKKDTLSGTGVPIIQEEYHPLIAELAASKILILDGAPNAEIFAASVKEDIGELIAEFKEKELSEEYGEI